MMRRTGFWTLLLVWGLLSQAFAQATVENEEQGFALTLLPGWTRLANKPDFPTSYLRVSSPAGVADGALYLQVFQQGSYTPESYRAAVRRYVTETMDGEILADRPIVVNEREAWRIEYQGESVGYTGDRRHFMNTVIFHDGKIFAVHCASTNQAWESVKDGFEQISSTLVLE